MGYSPWGHKESDTPEGLTHAQTVARQAPCPRGSPGENARVDGHALLQRIFSTQGYLNHFAAQQKRTRHCKSTQLQFKKLKYTVCAQMALVAKNPPSNAGDRRGTGSTPMVGYSP